MTASAKGETARVGRTRHEPASRASPDELRYQQDRRTDSGKSWDEALLVIDARRVAASAQR